MSEFGLKMIAYKHI